MRTVRFTLDGRELAAPEGTLVLEAARRAGIHIPHYCYHPALGNPGNCRLCIVEVAGMPRPQVSCRLRAAEGMVVRSSSPGARRAQASSLELHLVNHPLDCPVCDQAGECGLQDYYMGYGLYESQVREDKLHKGKRIPIGPRVMLDQERCILCTRCTRFVDEVSKTRELGIFGRGDQEVLAPVPGRRVDNPYSGNLVDVCPVGALTDRDFRFKVRVWYLESAPSVCSGCSRGCSIDLQSSARLWHTSGERVARIKPRENPSVNGFWICDEGRYGYAVHNKDRLSKVRRRSGAAFEPVSWEAAIGALAAELESHIAARGPEGLAVVLSGNLSNEDFFLARSLFAERLGCRLFVFGPEPEQVGSEDALLRRREKVPNLAGGRALGFGTRIPDAGWAALEGALEKGQVWGLWVVERDLAAAWGEETAALLDRLKFLVYQGPRLLPFTARAGWILPSTTHAEEEGSFTNFEGNVQRYAQALEPIGQSRSEWEVWRDLLKQLGGGTSSPYGSVGRLQGLGGGTSSPYGSVAEVFARLAASEPAFSGLAWGDLVPHGRKLKSGPAPPGAGAPPPGVGAAP